MPDHPFTTGAGSVLSLIAQLINRGRPDGDNALLGLEAIQTIILLPGTAFGGGPRRGSRPATQVHRLSGTAVALTLLLVLILSNHMKGHELL